MADEKPNPETVDKIIDKIVTKVNAEQSDYIAEEIAKAFVDGVTQAEKELKKASSTLQSATEEELSRQQKSAIQQLSAEHFGYIAEFNAAVGEQLKREARNLLQQEKGYSEVKKEILQYTDDVFGGKETVMIDRVGQTRNIIKVGKDGALREVEKTITRPYHSSVTDYADMLSRTSTHSAWERGRASEYQRQGFGRWQFVGPIDERSRPDHVAILGNVYEYGTEQSDYALRLLDEPNCRHRAVVYFEDEELDTPGDFFEQQKEQAGLKWDEEKDEWAFV